MTSHDVHTMTSHDVIHFHTLYTHVASGAGSGMELCSGYPTCLETYQFFLELMKRLNFTSDCYLVNGTRCGEGETEGRGGTGLTDPAKGLQPVGVNFVRLPWKQHYFTIIDRWLMMASTVFFNILYTIAFFGQRASEQNHRCTRKICKLSRTFQS